MGDPQQGKRKNGQATQGKAWLQVFGGFVFLGLVGFDAYFPDFEPPIYAYIGAVAFMLGARPETFAEIVNRIWGNGKK